MACCRQEKNWGQTNLIVDSGFGLGADIPNKTSFGELLLVDGSLANAVLLQ
jgi:hypothetical protein